MIKIDIRHYVASLDRKLLYKLGVVVFLYALFFIFLLIPSVHELSTLLEKKKTNKISTEKSLKSAELMTQLSQQKMELEVLLRDTYGRIATERLVKNFAAEVSGLASNAGVTIVEISPIESDYFQDETLRTYCDVHAFQLDIESGFHQLGKFVEALENFEYLTRIVYLKILPGQTNEKVHLARIKVVMFSQKKDFIAS